MWPSSYCLGRASFPWGTTRKSRAGRPKSVCWAPRTFGRASPSWHATCFTLCIGPGSLRSTRPAGKREANGGSTDAEPDKTHTDYPGCLDHRCRGSRRRLRGDGHGQPDGDRHRATAIEITVPGTASISANAGVAGGCGTANTSITAKSNKVWSMQIRANAANTGGKAKDASPTPVFLTNAFQWGTDGASYVAITTAYADAFTAQAKTGSAGVSKTVYYKQCVTYDDDAGDYTIVAEYQASN